MQTPDYHCALEAYESLKALGLKLNMARGKPSPEQLDLSANFLNAVNGQNYLSADGVDTRNYGELKGLREARELMASMLGFPVENVVIGGCSSLTVMYDVHTRLLLTSPPGGDKPWFEIRDRACLCPCPGYDRHFQMTEGLGYRLIPVDMKEDGPDMDEVERLVTEDASIRCIWCVPKYANPTGVVYSEEVCRRLASMKTAAPDFRIFWDDAYAVHDLYPGEKAVDCPNMLKLCEEAGHPDRLFAFCSTSKITMAGGGIAAFAASQQNLEWFTRQQKLQMICTDKVNQLRHAHFFPHFSDLKAHMQKEAEILRPKFETVLRILDEELAGAPGVSWTRPLGGYFIGLTLPDGCASRTVELAKEAGMNLTPAGAPFPYGKDPHDAFLRIAPSYPSLEEIEAAARLLAACARLAIAEKAKGTAAE